MRLWYLIDSVGTPGGAEQSLALLAPQYRRLGVELTVATLHDRPGHQDALAAADARLVNVAGGGRASWYRSVVAALRRDRPDLVHTTLFEADVVGRAAARRVGIPVVSSIVNASYGPDHFADPSLRPWRLRGAWLLDAATARLAVRLHAVSTHVADSMATRLRYPRERIDVVPRGRSLAEVGERTVDRAARVRGVLGIGPDEFVVLAVGRQEHQKGLDVAIEAVRRLLGRVPQARLVVAGRAGAHTPDLARRAAPLGDRVQFLGTRADVADLHCAADVLVLPSRREGSPGVLLEAMAMGTPVVAAAIPQVDEIVDETMARLVPVDDAEGLSAALAEVRADPRSARDRAARARARFLSAFTIERVAEQMVAFYRRALQDSWGAQRG